MHFSCHILKVNFCLFSSFLYQQYPASPTDGSLNTISGQFPCKGHLRILAGCHIAFVMKYCCYWSLGSTGGKSFWQPLSQPTEDSFLSCMHCSSKWKSFLFTTIISRFHTRCSGISHSHILQTMRRGEEIFAKGKISCCFLTAKKKSKEACF